MDVYSKFIVEQDFITIGKCTFHKNLAMDEKDVKGGGMYKFNPERNTFLLYGESYDFGEASLDDIKNAVEKGKVFLSRSQRQDISKKHKFKYLNKIGDVIDLN